MLVSALQAFTNAALDVPRKYPVLPARYSTENAAVELPPAVSTKSAVALIKLAEDAPAIVASPSAYGGTNVAVEVPEKVTARSSIISTANAAVDVLLTINLASAAGLTNTALDVPAIAASNSRKVEAVNSIDQVPAVVQVYVWYPPETVWVGEPVTVAAS
jgi:hypothetical protein